MNHQTRLGLYITGGVVLAAAGAILTAHVSQAEVTARTIGSVTYLKGDATRASGRNAAWNPVRQETRLFQGDRLKTGPDSRLEATLLDGSKLRLAARSELNLERVNVGSKRKAKKKVTAKLVIGRLWASVTKLFGGDSEFQVTTENAVAGVRGTKFEASRTEGGDTTVKVYSGQVLVSNKPIYAVKGHTKSKRVQVAGPQEISKKQWEELVASAMQMVKVAANGTMGQAESFAMANPADDDWEAWNAERDKVAGLTE